MRANGYPSSRSARGIARPTERQADDPTWTFAIGAPEWSRTVTSISPLGEALASGSAEERGGEAGAAPACVMSSPLGCKLKSPTSLDVALSTTAWDYLTAIPAGRCRSLHSETFMTTRIIFNGQEYENPEAMPQTFETPIRRCWTSPGQGQGRYSRHTPRRERWKNVLGMLQTGELNGRTLENMGGLPAPLRRLIGNVIAHEISKGSAPAEPHGNEPLLRTLDTASRATERLLGVLLAFIAGFILIFSVGVMFAIGGGPELLKGRLAVAIAALLLLGRLDTQATRLARRRQPLLAPDTAGYRRFAVLSSLGLFLAAVILLSLAWFLP